MMNDKIEIMITMLKYVDQMIQVSCLLHKYETSKYYKACKNQV